MEPLDYLHFVFKCAALALKAEQDLHRSTCWDGVFFLAARYAAKLAKEVDDDFEYSDQYETLSFETRVSQMTKFLYHIEGWTKDEPVSVPLDFQKHVFEKYRVDGIETWAKELHLSTDETRFLEILLEMPHHNGCGIYSFHKKFNAYLQEHEEDMQILLNKGMHPALDQRLKLFSKSYRASIHFKMDFSAWLQRNIAGFTAFDYDAVIRGFFAFRERSQRASNQ